MEQRLDKHAELESRLSGKTLPVKISVLGCVVNGPGEAREADIGIAAGNGKGVIFRNGEIAVYDKKATQPNTGVYNCGADNLMSVKSYGG